jgi:hypothetical protein
MKPTRWSGQNETEFGPNLQMSFGDFHHVEIDNDGMEFITFSRNGFVVRAKKLDWQELFAVVFGQALPDGEVTTTEEC